MDFKPSIAIVVAAGRGIRAGGDRPKQYRRLAGRTVLARTVEAFASHPEIDRVVCVIAAGDEDAYRDAVDAIASEKLAVPVLGGETRQASVARAMEALDDLAPDAVVLVHDAARPFVGSDLVGRALIAGREHGAAIPGVAVTDTMKRVDSSGRVVETIDRDALRAVQTPQAFRLGLLRDAHRAAIAAGRDGFTDDGQLAEWTGAAVHVFPGDVTNTKLTHPEDFAAAERRLAGGSRDELRVRVGTGFDVHTFGAGDHVWLGGIRIPHNRGVEAHSDGDVVLHALTDALLGAIADGDIGTHFPPSDEQWRGASSDRFLAYAADLVRGRGGMIDHLDVTVLCERPRVGAHRDAMQERIAAIAGIDPTAVSIKATTTERMGFTGREEGLAAQAAATIRVPA